MDAILALAVFCSSLLAPGACASSNWTRNSYLALKTLILEHQYAVNRVPPSVVENDMILVNVSFSPQQVLYVDESMMSLAVSGYIMLVWQEPEFVWNPDQYDNIDQVHVPPHMWTPALFNAKSLDGAHMMIQPTEDNVMVTSTGHVYASMTIVVISRCDFDLTFYPFDSQTCALTFLGAKTDTAPVALMAVEYMEVKMFLKDKFSSSTEWTFLGMDFRSEQIQLQDSSGLSFVEFQVEIDRQNRFYITNIVFPIMGTSSLTLAVFWIPAASGEKISFLTSLFISLTMFLSMVSDMMPRGSGSFSRFNAFIVVVVAENILAVLATVYVIRRHSEENNYLGQGPPNVDIGLGDITLNTRSALELREENENTNTSEVGDGLYEFKTTLGRAKVAPLTPYQAESTRPNSDVEHSTKLGRCLGLFCVSRMFNVMLGGERLSSDSLDRIFFVLFLLGSICAYGMLLFSFLLQ